MAYQIVKGWPSEGALDLKVYPTSGATLAGGQIVALDTATGKVAAATCATNGDAPGQLMFVIDVDTIEAGTTAATFGTKGAATALLSAFIVECDSDHYDAGTYAVNEAVSAKAGKFCKVTTSEVPCARVLSVDASTGKMRLLWTA